MSKPDFQNTAGANVNSAASRGIYHIPATERNSVYSNGEVHYMSAGYASTGLLQPPAAATPAPIAPTRPEPKQAAPAPQNLLATSLKYTKPPTQIHYAESPPIAPAPAPPAPSRGPDAGVPKARNGTLQGSPLRPRDPSGAAVVQPCPHATQSYVAAYGPESIRTRDLEPTRYSPKPQVKPSPVIAIGVRCI